MIVRNSSDGGRQQPGCSIGQRLAETRKIMDVSIVHHLGRFDPRPIGLDDSRISQTWTHRKYFSPEVELRIEIDYSGPREEK